MEEKIPAPDGNKEQQLEFVFPSPLLGFSKNSPTLESVKKVIPFVDLETLQLRQEAVRRVRAAGIFSTPSEK
ncbi:MAG: hypothetical protein V2I24_14945 [Halieaceae bacterium]|jgi:hypothetical protein|nr:hypothetical protein [Halieaceae bacterium]